MSGMSATKGSHHIGASTEAEDVEAKLGRMRSETRSPGRASPQHSLARGSSVASSLEVHSTAPHSSMRACLVRHAVELGRRKAINTLLKPIPGCGAQDPMSALRAPLSCISTRCLSWSWWRLHSLTLDAGRSGEGRGVEGGGEDQGQGGQTRRFSFRPVGLGFCGPLSFCSGALDGSRVMLGTPPLLSQPTGGRLLYLTVWW